MASNRASDRGRPVTGHLSPFLKRLVPAFLLVVALLLLTNAQSILEHCFLDPDDALRLQQVRDWLAGQGWYDVTQHRLDPFHGGVVMHWSRLVDLPLAGVMLALRPLLGVAGAELAARVVVPMITLGVIMALMARLAWRMLGARATTMTCLMLMMTAPFVTQVLPMRIDHHGWQVACAVLALSGLLARRVALGASVAGLAMAASLDISVEGLPLAAVLAAVASLRWLRDEEGRLSLAYYMASLAGGSLVLFGLFRGFGDLADHCDQMSPVQLAVLGAAALGTVLTAAPARRWPWWARLAVMAVLGAVAGGLYLGMAPQCRAGAFNMLTPLVRHIWYDQVPEGLPIWRQSPLWALQIVLPPLFALMALLRLMMSARGAARLFWRDYALVLGGAFLVALMVARAAAVADALTALPLAWLVLLLLERARQSTPLPRLGWFMVLVLMVEPSAPFTLYDHLVPHGMAKGSGHGEEPVPGVDMAGGMGDDAERVWTCHLDQSARVLGRQPQGLILSGLDIAPELLLATHHTALASGHHRGARAMDATLRAFTLAPDQSHAVVRAEKVTYIALCPRTAESVSYRRIAPQGLAAQLLAGHVPAWLQPVPGQTDPRLRAWRVVG
ncbi:MAG: hypothetical protein KGJ57_13130 [Sphingomonadales bacterium]|nr:hypothetical protein [Sphingomonadales bacterium]MDE2170356.1 hypothetical protein [Sphingomonadales bacterium]